MKMRSAPLARKTRLVRRTELSPGKPLRRVEPGGLKRAPARGKVAAASGRGKAQARTETGFTTVQRLAIRTRAGNGDPGDARCEICGIWLGRYGGQVHHRMNRQSGGSRLRDHLSNAVLACGTPESGCHGKCTTGTGEVLAGMEAAGFVLRTGRDPERESILLAGLDGGLEVWIDDYAHYTDAQGNVLDAPPRRCS